MTLLLAMLLGSAEAVTPAAARTLLEPDPKAMSQKEIRAFNAALDKKHPFFIRCVSTIEIGTLSKRQYSCRTNRQWALADRIGNDNARESYDAMTSKSWDLSN